MSFLRTFGVCIFCFTSCELLISYGEGKIPECFSRENRAQEMSFMAEKHLFLVEQEKSNVFERFD